MNLTAVWKPWYVYRPHQLARRLASSISAPPAGHQLMPVSWEIELCETGAANDGLADIAADGEAASGVRTVPLHAHHIRHIVFEDHEGAGSRAMTLLRAAGYEIFSIGWSMRGLVLAPAADGSLAAAFEAPSYLATTETRAALEACRRPGWMVLHHQAHLAAEVVEA